MNKKLVHRSPTLLRLEELRPGTLLTWYYQILLACELLSTAFNVAFRPRHAQECFVGSRGCLYLFFFFLACRMSYLLSFWLVERSHGALNVCCCCCCCQMGRHGGSLRAVHSPRVILFDIQVTWINISIIFLHDFKNLAWKSWVLRLFTLFFYK